MGTATTVPVTITLEAAQHVAQLGMQAALDQMLEQARKLIPGLLGLNVVLDPPYDTGDEDAVVIEAIRDESFAQEANPARYRYRDWEIKTFPPQVFTHFTLLIQYRSNHAG